MAARISKADFDEKVIKAEKPVLVDFYSDGCVACKKLSPVLGDIEDDYGDKIDVYRINAGFDSELAEEYDIASTPTLILFQQGKALQQKSGAQKKADLIAWLGDVLK